MDRRDLLTNELRQIISSQQIVNTHTHYLHHLDFNDFGFQELLSRSYANWKTPSPEQGLAHMETYVKQMRSNSYFKWLFAAIEKIYGVPVQDDNFTEVDSAIRGAGFTAAKRLEYLKDQCCYDKMLLDSYWNYGTDQGEPWLFVPVYRVDMFFTGYVKDGKDFNNNCARAQSCMDGVCGLDEYVQALHAQMKEQKQKGAVAFKIATAYERGLDFERPQKAVAERAFDNADANTEEIKRFGDYVAYQAAQFAAELGLPLQIHTGMGRLTKTNPLQLLYLINDNPDTKFVLFHGGMPWLDDTVALVHNYANVFVDLCWLPLIAPQYARRHIKDILQIGDAHRMTWGCDTHTMEESTGALLAMTQALSAAVADLISEGYFHEDYGIYCIERMLRANAQAIYHFGGEV